MVTNRRMISRIFLGLVLAGFGFVALLQNFGMVEYDLGFYIGRYWPVVLIVFGVLGTLTAVSEGRGILWGSLIVNVIVVLVGVSLLGSVNGWYYFDWSLPFKLIFPALLMFAGYMLLRGGVQRPGAQTCWAVMSGGRRTLTRWDDLSVITLMGGLKVDLTQAGLPDRENMIVDVFTIMGGADIYVPNTVTLECEWNGLMGALTVDSHTIGGFADARRMTVGQGPKVILRVHSVMGGAKVVTVPVVG